MDQYWSLFAPRPYTEDGWYVIPATLQDGTKVDLFRGGAAPVDWNKPALVSSLYKNHRWRKYLDELRLKTNTNLRLFYACYLVRRWNEKHPPHKHIRELSIYFMVENTLPNYQVSAPEKALLWHLRTRQD